MKKMIIGTIMMVAIVALIGGFATKEMIEREDKEFKERIESLQNEMDEFEEKIETGELIRVEVVDEEGNSRIETWINKEYVEAGDFEGQETKALRI